MSDAVHESPQCGRELLRAEEALFDSLGVAGDRGTPMLVVLGAPRTGSTVLYQVLINHWKLTYFSNFTSEVFPHTPALGMAIEAGAGIDPYVAYESAYGKTTGWWNPSEASAVFRNWYGGLHPSETRSATVLPDREAHMDRTVEAAWRLRERPLIAKNAWNCFRVADLAGRYPNALFVWIRRDVVAAAASDLEARQRRGSKYSWNSATPANVAHLRELPYWEQVVEQQFEYHRAIRSDLQRWASGRYLDVWYEDLCRDARPALARLRGFLAAHGFADERDDAHLDGICPGPTRGEPSDTDRIRAYVEGSQAVRLSVLRYRASPHDADASVGRGRSAV